MNANPAIHNAHLQGNAFFLEAGQPGILLIHGFTATTAEVRPLAEVFHRQGYTVSAPLLPGHFTNPEELNRVKWQDWTEAVEIAYTELAAEHRPLVVGGESTGGLLSLHLAIKHPEIAAVLLYAPALRLNLPSKTTLMLRLLAPFIPSFPKPHLDGNPFWQGYRVNPLKGTLQLLRLQKYIIPQLHKVQQPVLVIQGRKDLTVHPDVPETIYQNVSSQIKEKYWMENSAHCVIIDQEMEKVNQLTLDFIQRVIPGI